MNKRVKSSVNNLLTGSHQLANVHTMNTNSKARRASKQTAPERPRNGELKTKPTTIYLPSDELRETIQKYARENQRSVSNLMTAAIIEYLTRREVELPADVPVPKEATAA